MTTITNTAQEYALLIKRELVALETLAEYAFDINWNDGSYSGDDETDTALLAITNAMNELELEFDGVQRNPYDVVVQYLNNQLEVVTLRADNDRNRYRVEILRTCGGPRCDITRDSNDGDNLEIRVYDSPSVATVRVSLPNVAAEIDEMALIGGE